MTITIQNDSRAQATRTARSLAARAPERGFEGMTRAQGHLAFYSGSLTIEAIGTDTVVSSSYFSASTIEDSLLTPAMRERGVLYGLGAAK